MRRNTFYSLLIMIASAILLVHNYLGGGNLELPAAVLGVSIISAYESTRGKEEDKASFYRSLMTLAFSVFGFVYVQLSESISALPLSFILAFLVSVIIVKNQLELKNYI